MLGRDRWHISRPQYCASIHQCPSHHVSMKRETLRHPPLLMYYHINIKCIRNYDDKTITNRLPGPVSSSRVRGYVSKSFQSSATRSSGWEKHVPFQANKRSGVAVDVCMYIIIEITTLVGGGFGNPRKLNSGPGCQ